MKRPRIDLDAILFGAAVVAVVVWAASLIVAMVVA